MDEMWVAFCEFLVVAGNILAIFCIVMSVIQNSIPFGLAAIALAILSKI